MSEPTEYLYAEVGVDAEIRRLRLLEQTYDAFSHRALSFASIEPGWRCLELGAGAGSMAAWLAQATGPSGTIVAADIDTRHLVNLPANIDVRAMDVRCDELGSGFDLIHARCLLQHLAERDQVLRAMVAALRPGGCLVCEETTAGVTSGPVLDRLVSDPETVGAFLDGAIIHTEMAGIDWIRHAYRLPMKLERVGLERVGSQMFTPLGRGGDPLALFLLVSRQNRASVAGSQDGGDAALGARIDAWLTDPSEVVLAPPLVSAWGFKPLA